MGRFFILAVAAVLLVSNANACNKAYRPVCCREPRAFIPTTVGNACVCTELRRGTVLYHGECKSGGPIACPLIFKPVCCKIPGVADFQTTGNSCECESQRNGIVVSTGACKPLSPTLPPNPPICTLEYEPVCCRAKNALRPRTVGNKCQCGTGTVLYKGKCHLAQPLPPPPICPLVVDPVCCLAKGSLKPRTTSNKCFCGTGRVLNKGKCNGIDLI